MKTKLFTAILIVHLPFIICSAQAPGWQWARGAGGPFIDEAIAVAVDAIGNSYVTGVYASFTIVFGPDTLTLAGTGTNVFLAKYDAGGNVLWAKDARGVARDVAISVAVDGVGNSYITGFFDSPNIIFGSDTLFSTGNHNIFLAKYDAGGNVLWAKSPTGGIQDIAYSVAVDGTGNIYIAGSFQGNSITFDSTTLTNSNAADDDLFLVKYDVNGNVLWARGAGSTGTDVAVSVAVDGAGNSFLTGYFDSPSLAFGSTTLTSPNLLFLTKYDASGNVLWARGIGGNGNDYAPSVAVDGTGNVFIAGYFYTASIIFGTDTLMNAGSFSDDLFLAKYDSNGNVLWARRAGSADKDDAFAVAVDGTGNSYISGAFFGSSIAFGTTVLMNQNAGAADLFIAKYDASGTMLWAQDATCVNPDIAFSVAMNGAGDCVIAGYFGDPATATPTLTVGSTVLTNAGILDMFLAKLNTPTGIEAELNSKTITIYPNPSESEVMITSANYLKDATLTICNAVGQEVKNIKNISGYEIKLQRDNLPVGIYFIRLMQSNETLAMEKLLLID